MLKILPGFDNLDAIKSDGSVVTAKKFGSNKGCTLANSSTYYVPLGGEQSELIGDMPYASMQIIGDSALVATITLETSNLPLYERGLDAGPVDTDNYVSTAGSWVPCNPSGASVDVTGAGWSSAAATVTVAGGAAGAAMYEIGNLPARRARMKIVVTTGGLVRFAAHGKSAA